MTRQKRTFSAMGHRGLGAVCLGALLLACDPAGAPEQAADMVLLDGVVATMDAERSRAEALAIRGGRIVFVGSSGEASEWIGDGTAVVKLGGRLLLPAFQDAHVHPLDGGVELADCDLNPQPDAEAVLAKIAECAGRSEAAWVRGGGFQLPLFPGGSPSAAALDAIVADRPVFLTSADGHSAWVNSRALEIAGITAASVDPPLGRIERHPATGEPTGTLRESAIELVSRHLPARTTEELVEGLRRGLAMAARFGITALQEASADEDRLVAYAALAREGALTARVSVSLDGDEGRGVEQVEELVELRRRFNAPGLRVETVKLFVDGVIEGRTAALLEPYVGQGDFRGELNFEPAALEELVAALDAQGFQVHVHAIGDRAIRIALDAFAHARQVNGERDSRHHIAHAQLIDPADIPRFRELGVYANFQPLWAYADSYITELTEPVLGAERSRWLYPVASVVASGATVVFGSDWSVSSMNPLLGIEVGITRSDPSKTEVTSWIPEERTDLETMLAGYTIDAARVNFLDSESGSIEVGKAADLIVLDRDLFAIPAAEIGEAEVLLTLLAGEIIHADSPFDEARQPSSAG